MAKYQFHRSGLAVSDAATAEPGARPGPGMMLATPRSRGARGVRRRRRSSIGSGPVGTVDRARASPTAGCRVLVLESGGPGPEPAADGPRRRREPDPDSHFEPHTAVARRLGGTSNLWAGRCVPFDPIDFAPGPGSGPRRPGRSPRRLAPWLAPALAALGAGEPVFAAAVARASPPIRRSAATRLERWTNEPRIQKLHGAALAGRPDLRWRSAPPSPAFATDRGGAVAGRGSPGRADRRRRAGGPWLQVPRRPRRRRQRQHAAAAPRAGARRRARFGGAGGPLGRFYMGHLSGEIADVVFLDRARCTMRSTTTSTPTAPTSAAGSWPATATQDGRARQRRLLAGGAADRQRRAPLGAALGGVPRALARAARPAADRRAGAAEARRARRPRRRGAHCANVAPRPAADPRLRAPPSCGRTAWRRCGCPGFFLRNRARRYGLEYHAEQLPDPVSRLDPRREPATGSASGGSRIDLRFSARGRGGGRARPRRARGLARAQPPRPARVLPGRPRGAAAAVLAIARDGAHQVGTIRMGGAAGKAVVDGDCRAFGVPEPLRRLDRGAADLGPGEPDADRGAARAAARGRDPGGAAVKGADFTREIAGKRLNPDGFILIKIGSASNGGEQPRQVAGRDADARRICPSTNPSAHAPPGGGRDSAPTRGARGRIGTLPQKSRPLPASAHPALRPAARPRQCLGLSGRDSRGRGPRFGRSGTSWRRSALGLEKDSGMRRVTLGETGIETSCLGFGCASLGSRVAAADGRAGAGGGVRRGRHLVRPRAALRRRPGRGDRRAVPEGAPRRGADRLKVGLAPAGQGGSRRC